MRYHNITVDDMLNGDGLRTVLWLSGCDHRCRGCQNPQTWDPDDGLPFDDAAREELFSYLARDYISGLTLSGGDPLYAGNRKDVGELVCQVRRQFPEKTIWLYTGSLFEEIRDLSFLPLIDVVVDGPFVREQADPQLHWKGSANQRVIDVRATLSQGRVVIWEQNAPTFPLMTDRSACCCS